MHIHQLNHNGLIDLRLGELNAALAFASGSSACFDLTDPKSRSERVFDANESDPIESEDGTFMVVSSFTTQTVVGEVVIHHPCLDCIRARLQVRIPSQWHRPDFLLSMREKLFDVLSIPLEDTWELIAIDGESVVILGHED